MQKSDIVEKMAADAGISKAAADRALRSLIDSITQTLKKGERVSLVGFGTFSVSKRAARLGRNPKTGESIRIKASNAPRFVAGKTLKDSVNK